jgi:hypothetical protein
MDVLCEGRNRRKIEESAGSAERVRLGDAKRVSKHEGKRRND